MPHHTTRISHFSIAILFSVALLSISFDLNPGVLATTTPPDETALANATEPVTAYNTCIDPTDPAWRPVPCNTVFVQRSQSPSWQRPASRLSWHAGQQATAGSKAAGSAALKDTEEGVSARVSAQRLKGRPPATASPANTSTNTTATPSSAPEPPSYTPRVIDVALQCQFRGPQCDKVLRAFQFVDEQLSRVIQVKRPLKVIASYYSFCDVDKIGCDAEARFRPIGTAGPSLLVPLPFSDQEGHHRLSLFPQALSKQRDLTTHPEYMEYDIIAKFSTDARVWFPEDGEPIGTSQTDFRWVALHEIIHGLGFGITSWRDWTTTDQAQAEYLTPYPVSDVTDYLWDGFTFNGQFFQTAFDTGLVNTALKGWRHGQYKLPIMVRRRLDGFAGSQPREFASLEEFKSTLLASPAARNTQVMRYLVHGRERGVGFNPEDGGQILLLSTGEHFSRDSPTSLIGHLDQQTYKDTTDFLMTPVVSVGITLEERWRQVGGNPADMRLVDGATRRVLCFLGYKRSSAMDDATFTPSFTFPFPSRGDSLFEQFMDTPTRADRLNSRVDEASTFF